MEQLGYTLPEIAGEKAGIFKAGAPAYTAAGQTPEVMNVLRSHATFHKALFYVVLSWQLIFPQIPLTVASPLSAYLLPRKINDIKLGILYL